MRVTFGVLPSLVANRFHQNDVGVVAPRHPPAQLLGGWTEFSSFTNVESERPLGQARSMCPWLYSTKVRAVFSEAIAVKQLN